MTYRLALTLALPALLLAGCAADRPAPVARAPQPRPVTQVKAPPPPPPAPALAIPAESGEAVWHLRAGLNVAALSCRGAGRAAVAPVYSRVLSRHRTLLAAAYAGEQRRHGSGLDRHLTQLYNRFTNQRSPEAFCRNAASVGNQAVQLDSATLSAQARRLLGELG